MAGEGLGPEPTYNDISANKLANKASLLELSVKIKDYVDQNSGGATGPQIITCSYTPNNLTKNNCPSAVKNALLDVLSGNAAPTQYIFYFGSSNWSYGNGFWYITRVYKYDYWYIDLVEQNYKDRSVSPFDKTGLQFWFDKDEPHTLSLISSGNVQSTEYISTTSSSNMTGNTFAASLEDNLIYIKNNFAKLTDIPAAELPTIASGDEGKALVVNSTGTGVEWGTVSGGTTYTAGTGISITNGVISLDLANASQEEM